MKFLIFGCNGMAGHMVSLYLQVRGHEVIGFARSRSKLVKTIVGDVFDWKKVQSVIEENHFDALINCVGILNLYAEQNKDLAVYLNSFFPHSLARMTQRKNTQVIHISTDCVFSGKKGQYTENDFWDGTSFYDRSKALGELNDNKNLTLRQSIVGPDLKPEGIGLLNWFMQQQGEVYGYTQVFWTGVTTLQLAKIIEEASNKKAYGVYNMVPSYAISKYDLLRLFNKYLRGENIRIVPDDKICINKSLKRTRFDFAQNIPDYEQMIAELADWMCKYRVLYPHYKL